MSNRYALVIANEDYGDNVRSLRGARGDAVSIAKTLDDMGFTIKPLLNDADKGEMRMAIREAIRQMNKGDIFVF